MNRLRSFATLALFLLIVAGVAASGVQFQPGDWYAQLAKPFWTPPSWLFPPVWTLLYVMIAVAGWLIFSGEDNTLKVLWVVQLVLNGLWSWLFFGRHHTLLGLVDILAMLACIAALVIFSRTTMKTVSWLLTPYLLWVGYASTLNAAIWILNDAR
jgi:translocator protein